MATVTSRNIRIAKGPMRRIESDIEVVADTIVIDGLTEEMVHCFLGLQFFEDSAGATPGTPTAGSAVVTVETLNSEPVSEPVPSNTIDATAPTTVSWDANTRSVTIVPTGISGGSVTHYRAVWTGNRS